MARAEMEAVLAAPYLSSYQAWAPASVTVSVSSPGAGYANTQVVTVVAGAGSDTYTLTAIKTQLASASYPAAWPFSGTGCQSP
jgi:hypothetical protein